MKVGQRVVWSYQDQPDHEEAVAIIRTFNDKEGESQGMRAEAARQKNES